MKYYLVGGAVRDQLLKRPVTECDWVVVGGTPEKMIAKGFKQVGKDFPVFLHPKTGEEYALARTERKRGHGYRGFECQFDPSVTIEEDLQRRDLTVNAIAKSLRGEIIDPYHGIADLHEKVFRHVSPAFVEDPLRVLRVARFSARYGGLGFKVFPTTNVLMRQIAASGELAYLVPERVWKEFAKALDETTPSYFFKILHLCGALEKIFPEINRLFGIPSMPSQQDEIDNGLHIFRSIDRAASKGYDSVVRFAVLMHNIGKILTPMESWPEHHGYELAGVKVINEFCARWRIPKRQQALAVLVSQFHNTCHNAMHLKPAGVVALLQQVDAFRRQKRFGQFLDACQADFEARQTTENEPYQSRAFLEKAYALASKVNADDLIKQGLKGMEIAKALFLQRVEQVRQLY